MKTRTLLLIAALVSGLSFAQAEPATETQPKTEFQQLAESLKAAETPEALYAWERDAFAPKLGELKEKELQLLVPDMANKYHSVGKVAGGYNAALLALVPKYVPNWETSDSVLSEAFYRLRYVVPAFLALRASAQAATTKDELASVVAEYFAKNLYPERFVGKDSRDFTFLNIANHIATSAIRLGAPDAVNWTMVLYRLTDIKTQYRVDAAIGLVASALKAKDFNLTRANAFVEGQNTGQPAVEFTAGELALPPVIANLSVFANLDTTAALAAAKESYRQAKTSAQVDAAIYRIADVLKAHDLNLARANAWIEAQKNGETFDLTLGE